MADNQRFLFQTPFRKLMALLFIGTLLTGCGLTNGNTRGKAIDLAPETTAQIPFDTIQNLIIIEAEINGHKGRFLFDNGFTLSAIHSDFAEKAGITFNKSATANDINNKKSTLEETTVASIKIGDIDFQKTGFYKIDTKKFFPCDDIDGVIGGSIINKVNWKVLYRDRKIILSKQAFSVPEDSGTVIDVLFTRGNSAMAELTLQEETINFKVDIGMSGEMAIRKSEFGHLYTGFDAVKSDGITSLGATGLGNIEHNYDLAERVHVSSGDVALPVEAKLELEQAQKYDGYLGVGYLKHYDFIVNSTEKQYILTTPIAPAEKVASNYGIGLYIIDDTCRIIQKNGFDPLLNGIALMSIVTTIDDQETSAFRSVCDLKAYFRKKYAEKSDMVLQLGDNEEPLVLPYREAVLGPVEE